ncbi:unnamed protein product [Nesidiocoris tenuis]|uniref:Uncharacterized protein n=1 Tax=Nesidiocoris tenuis TaxID=355587 RepID=A0A6H5HJD3_9HEMI|nr:unnamed protein product [Nesidiocoris tenuis]
MKFSYGIFISPRAYKKRRTIEKSSKLTKGLKTSADPYYRDKYADVATNCHQKAKICFNGVRPSAEGNFHCLKDKMGQEENFFPSTRSTRGGSAE